MSSLIILLLNMPLKLYIDWLSQPSRFVATVFDLLRVPHEIVEVRIGEGKQRTPDFAKINQFRKGKKEKLKISARYI